MNTALKQSLKAQAHHLKPIILLGAKGISEAVVAETDLALNTHELIKVKLNGVEKEDKIQVANELCQLVHAELIQMIGNTIVIYRKNEEKPNPSRNR